MTVESFSRAKAEASGDCREWTVVDALRAALADVESGEVKPDMVYIAFREVDDGVMRFPSICAGITRFELTALLAKHMHYELVGASVESE